MGRQSLKVDGLSHLGMRALVPLKPFQGSLQFHKSDFSIQVHNILLVNKLREELCYSYDFCKGGIGRSLIDLFKMRGCKRGQIREGIHLNILLIFQFLDSVDYLSSICKLVEEFCVIISLLQPYCSTSQSP